jgi:hypothetical protein
MTALIQRIYRKNKPLFYAGLVCFAGFLYCLFKQQFSSEMLLGESVWNKPARYFFSGWMFQWTMSLIMHHLNSRSTRRVISFALALIVPGIALTMLAEQLFFPVGYQAEMDGIRMLKTVLYILFFLMMVWICLLFFIQRKNPRSQHYTWGLRMALLIFTGSLLLGLVMHYLGTYTVGGLHGSPGIPFFNWSKKFGDLRLVLFMGIHSLQIIPLLSHYFFEKKKQVVFFSLIYLMLVLAALFFTLLGQSFF